MPPKPELTSAQEAALERVRTAAQEYERARAAYEKANAARIDTLRKAWPTLRTLGPTRIAREVGEDILGEATVRGLTRDLRAAERGHTT